MTSSGVSSSLFFECVLFFLDCGCWEEQIYSAHVHFIMPSFASSRLSLESALLYYLDCSFVCFDVIAVGPVCGCEASRVALQSIRDKGLNIERGAGTRAAARAAIKIQHCLFKCHCSHEAVDCTHYKKCLVYFT